jgi:hypothetical protein
LLGLLCHFLAILCILLETFDFVQGVVSMMLSAAEPALYVRVGALSPDDPELPPYAILSVEPAVPHSPPLPPAPLLPPAPPLVTPRFLVLATPNKLPVLLYPPPAPKPPLPETRIAAPKAAAYSLEKTQARRARRAFMAMGPEIEKKAPAWVTFRATILQAMRMAKSIANM